MRKAVYTVVTGDYDIVSEPAVKDPDWDYFCFYYGNTPRLAGYRLIQLPNLNNYNNKLLSREPKILFHEYLKDYDYIIYHDAHLQINIDPEYLFNLYKESDIAQAIHPSRKCAYKECRVVERSNKESQENVNRIISLFRRNNYPCNNGLHANGILLRWNNEKVRDLMDKWWEMVKEYSHRDQLTYNYCLYFFGENIKINYFEYQFKSRLNWFKFKSHNK